jgi:16S rRNA (uracil1498-N3)-methyltransferase
LHQDFLSDIELYYSADVDVTNNIIIISEDEAHHAFNVMRHSEGDILHVTDGLGKIYKAKIIKINKNEIQLNILQALKYINEYEDIYFCIPRLKNNDRFEFAIEKCIELGITNFIIFESDRTIAKGDKTEKWIKFGISAMKQSIRAFVPKFVFKKSIDEIITGYSNNGFKLYLFDQKAETRFVDELDEIMNSEDKSVFLFGPEGGISERELYLLKDVKFLGLTGNRLRSETAVIAAGIMITQ